MRKSAVYMLALSSFPIRDAFATQLRRVLSIRRIRVLLVFGLSRHPCGRSDSLIRQRMLDAEAPRPDRTALEAMGREWGSMHADFKRAVEDAPDWLWLKFENVDDEVEAIRAGTRPFEIGLYEGF
ncbi:MAG TPA: hypothetical protein VFG22_17730 [Polyangiales bacterium]|nr:hypothetical protein [Polyangiales bacterium]